MLSFIRRHRLATAVSAIVTVAGLTALAFGYFGVHTLLIDEEVSEAAPAFDAEGTAVSPASPTPAPAGPTSTSASEADDDSAEPADLGEPVGGTGAVSTLIPTSTPTPTPTGTDAPVVVTERRGDFVSGSHPTSGIAVVLGNGTGQRFLRFEDFETDNGPDLNVYLVNGSTGDVSDYIDLGDLKGNIGEQNYEIPRDVDLDIYGRVVIWCVRFGVDFGSADLTGL